MRRRVTKLTLLALALACVGPVYYTHLDVYKRQACNGRHYSTPRCLTLRCKRGMRHEYVCRQQPAHRRHRASHMDNPSRKITRNHFKTCLLYTSRCV